MGIWAALCYVECRTQGVVGWVVGKYWKIGNSDRTLFSFGCFKEWDRYIGILGRVGIIVNLGRTLLYWKELARRGVMFSGNRGLEN